MVHNGRSRLRPGDGSERATRRKRMAETQTADTSSSSDLAKAMRAVEDDPTSTSHWQKLDELLEAEQQPDAIRGLFGRVLAQDLSHEVANDVGRRAVRFFETWYDTDGAALGSLLERVIEIDSEAEWAFERLSVAYTLAAKWDALLAAYDRAIEHANEASRRARLLEEAAQVAKDFASEPDRAIAYMEQLYGLDLAKQLLVA